MEALGKYPKELDSLVREAIKRGADRAKIIRTSVIVVDERVRLKCTVPLCDNYGRHLLCPPNLMPIDEFRKVLKAYNYGLLIQVDSEYDSTDRASRHIDRDLCVEVEEASPGAHKWEKKLQGLVEQMESVAFKKGFYLAAGLSCSHCLLCRDCVGQGSEEPCRHPFRARPSMQAMGIDVIKTCERARMPVRLSSSEKVKWTGLVLLK